ncbi:glutamate-rich protein 6 isoform X2 [Macrotis lagotis]|uniref:glutamate-rich protein 6 isoform X2 n=1 Tax=Macrotis lagotis TaxID=92651 RepID=UPI003D680C35
MASSSSGKSLSLPADGSQTADASSQTTEESFSSRNNGIPKVLRSFRRQSSSSYQDLTGEENIEPISNLNENDVAMQTDSSWLRDNYEKTISLKSKISKEEEIEETMSETKEKSSQQKMTAIDAFDSSRQEVVSSDSYCPLIQAQWTVNESLQKLDILYEMEFKEDFKIFFEPFLETLPRIGPPAIIGYKPESSPQNIILEWDKETSPTCEFCGADLRPFPSMEDINFESESYDHLFCCLEFKRLVEYVLQEKNLLKSRYPESNLITIEPHSAFGSEQDRLKAREKALRRKQERQMARNFVFLSAEREEGEPILTKGHQAASKQTRPTTYQLARNPSLKVKRVDKIVDTFDEHSGDVWVLPCLKKIEKEFLVKYYQHGGKFLTVFPDATGQIFYPSGNLAVIVLTNKMKGFICVIQEDTANKPAIRAVMDSRGKINCYYPNGNIWINTNISGGQFSDQEGNRVRTWKWSSTMTSLPLVSFKPIFLSLNNYVGIRILDQDKIIVSFLAMGQQARMNVGIKLKVEEQEKIPKLKYFTDEELFLLAFIIKIRRLLSKIEICVNFPSIENWYKLKTPSYLATRAIKLLSICQYYELSKDALSTITELLNEPI